VERKELERLLRQVRAGRTTVAEAVKRLARLPYEELGFAKVDHHRRLRRGFPEVVFGEGKTAEQLLAIVGRLAAGEGPVLATRVGPAEAEPVLAAHSSAEYFPAARVLRIPPRRRQRPRQGVAVISAGTSDLPVSEEAALTAEAMGCAVDRIHDVGVAGLHRLLDHQDRLREARVAVVVAGMEGALPSVVAGLIEAPVIGVPTSVGYGASFGGIAPLLAMLNSCAAGVVVVNIDNGFGAGFAAAQILRSRRARS
jgi:NCAIR mutase (PurE)-related protein